MESRLRIDRSRKVGIEVDRCDRFRYACRDRRPGMLNIPAERLRRGIGDDIFRATVEWIEEADAGWVCGRVLMRRVKIPKDGKGRGPPGVMEGVEVTRICWLWTSFGIEVAVAASRSAASGRRIERGKQEIGWRRTRGP